MADDFDLDVGLTGPASLASDPSTPAAPATPAEDIVELRIKDEQYSVPKDEIQAFADRLGWSMDELKEAIQIGRDGRNVYRGIADEKERLRQASENLREREALLSARPATPPGGPVPSDRPAGGFRPRPPAEDTIGQVQWLGDAFEQILPVLGRLPKIEEGVNRSLTTYESQQRELADQAERAASMSAYNEVAANFKKQGLELPPREQLEQELLNGIPFDQDLQLSWHQVWEKAAWAHSGERFVRQMRRKAVLDSQTPRGLAPAAAAHRPSPGGGGPASTPVSGMGDGPKSLEQLEAEGKELERALQGVTVADVAPHLSRR